MFCLLVVCVALLPLAAVAPAAAQDAEADGPMVFNLRPQPKAGQVSRYQIWTGRTQYTTGTVNGQQRGETTTVIEVNGEMTWTINAVSPDGSYDATMQFDFLAVEVTLPNGDKHSVDSRRPNPGEPLSTMHDLVRAMSSNPLSVKMTADGSVSSVGGVNAIRNAVGEENDPPTELDFMESASDLATLLEAPASIGIGQSWSVNRTWSREIAQLEADLTTQTKYTLAGVENVAGIELATITGEARCTLDPEMPEMPQGAPRPRLSASANVSSAIMFDMARREAVGRHSTENLRLQVDIQMPNANVQTVVEEVIQSQALRISESD